MSQHDPLITSLTKFYDTLVALHYIDECEIVRPPPQGHDHLNITAAKEEGLDDQAIEVLRRIPYLKQHCYDLSLTNDYDTKPITYIDTKDFSGARDPVYQGFPMTKATHFCLTCPCQYGIALVYDVETCRCIPWSPFNDQVPEEVKTAHPESRAPDGLEYAHQPTYAPEDVLGEWTANWIALNWLPYWLHKDGGREVIDERTIKSLKRDCKVDYLRDQIQLQLIQRTLKDVYIAAGWNVDAGTDLAEAVRNFDGDDFERRKNQWTEKTQQTLDVAYREDWEWRRVREALRLDPEKASLLDDSPVPASQAIHHEL